MKTYERSLAEAEKAELLVDVHPNIVPIRSWDVDRLICHAQSEADKAIEKLIAKSAPLTSAHIQGVVEDLRRLHAEMVFSASLRLLPVSWPFRGVGGFCLMILLVATNFTEPVVDAFLTSLVGIIEMICGGFLAMAFRRYMQRVGDRNKRLRTLYFGMIACCVFGALLCGLAWLRLTSVGI